MEDWFAETYHGCVSHEFAEENRGIYLEIRNQMISTTDIDALIKKLTELRAEMKETNYGAVQDTSS